MVGRFAVQAGDALALARERHERESSLRLDANEHLIEQLCDHPLRRLHVNLCLDRDRQPGAGRPA